MVRIREDELGSVTDVRDSPYCGGMESHSVHTKTASTFAQYFHDLRDQGLWSHVNTRTNTGVYAPLWNDVTILGTDDGRDHAQTGGIDDGNVLFIHTHGSHGAPTDTDNGWSALAMGSRADGCWAWTSYAMRLGNEHPDGSRGRLNIAVVKACQSTTQ